MANSWGGKRLGSGRKRQYVRVPTKFHVERCERELLTPETDLTACVAEMEENGPRGIMIGDIWYGRDEAIAIAAFVKKHKRWLTVQVASPS